MSAIVSSPGELRVPTGSGPPTESNAFGVGQSLTCTVSDVIAASGFRPNARTFVATCASGDFWSSLATCVPHIRDAPSSVGLPRIISSDRFAPSAALGVGQIRTAASVSVTFFPSTPPDAFASVAVAVGQDPDPLPLVRCASLGRGVQTPLRIEPEVGKVGEDVREPGPNKSGDVLQENESRSHVTDEPSDGRPEPPVIVSSTLLSCRRERLTGEPGSDEIHASTPRCTVERGEVRPDRSAIQGRVVHPRHESGRCVGVPLNVSHGSGRDSGESEGELESSVTGAEMQGT